MSLHLPWDQVGDSSSDGMENLKGGVPAVCKLIHGTDSSLAVVSRVPGYHSKPHVLDSEQLNWVVEGDIWIMVEKQAYHLKKGDFMRVPNGLIHWAWNRGSGPCQMVELHTPAHIALVKDGLAGLFDEGETPQIGRPLKLEWLQNAEAEEYAREAEAGILDGTAEANRGGLMACWDEMPTFAPSHHHGALTSKRVYGKDSQMQVATRINGYHSFPHLHDNEQLNWLLKGELWVFRGRKGYHMREGDFARVPSNKPHWAWNRGSDCVLVEGHCPPNILNPEFKASSVGLFRADEDPTPSRVVENTYPADREAYRQEVEDSIFGVQ